MAVEEVQYTPHVCLKQRAVQESPILEQARVIWFIGRFTFPRSFCSTQLLS